MESNCHGTSAPADGSDFSCSASALTAGGGGSNTPATRSAGGCGLSFGKGGRHEDKLPAAELGSGTNPVAFGGPLEATGGGRDAAKPPLFSFGATTTTLRTGTDDDPTKAPGGFSFGAPSRGTNVPAPENGASIVGVRFGAPAADHSNPCPAAAGGFSFGAHEPARATDVASNPPSSSSSSSSDAPGGGGGGPSSRSLAPVGSEQDATSPSTHNKTTTTTTTTSRYLKVRINGLGQETDATFLLRLNKDRSKIDTTVRMIPDAEKIAARRAKMQRKSSRNRGRTGGNMRGTRDWAPDPFCGEGAESVATGYRFIITVNERPYIMNAAYEDFANLVKRIQSPTAPILVLAHLAPGPVTRGTCTLMELVDLLGLRKCHNRPWRVQRIGWRGDEAFRRYVGSTLSRSWKSAFVQDYSRNWGMEWLLLRCQRSSNNNIASTSSPVGLDASLEAQKRIAALAVVHEHFGHDNNNLPREILPYIADFLMARPFLMDPFNCPFNRQPNSVRALSFWNLIGIVCLLFWADPWKPWKSLQLPTRAELETEAKHFVRMTYARLRKRLVYWKRELAMKWSIVWGRTTGSSSATSSCRGNSPLGGGRNDPFGGASKSGIRSNPFGGGEGKTSTRSNTFGARSTNPFGGGCSRGSPGTNPFGRPNNPQHTGTL